MSNLHPLDHIYGLKRWKVYYIGQVQAYGSPTGYFDMGLATTSTANSAGILPALSVVASHT